MFLHGEEVAAIDVAHFAELGGVFFVFERRLVVSVFFEIGFFPGRQRLGTASLQGLGRSGLPVYVLIDAQGKQSLLPELLSEQLVRDALVRLPAAQVQELP